jgi:hypothetical protein
MEYSYDLLNQAREETEKEQNRSEQLIEPRNCSLSTLHRSQQKCRKCAENYQKISKRTNSGSIVQVKFSNLIENKA